MYLDPWNSTYICKINQLNFHSPLLQLISVVKFVKPTYMYVGQFVHRKFTFRMSWSESSIHTQYKGAQDPFYMYMYISNVVVNNKANSECKVSVDEYVFADLLWSHLKWPSRWSRFCPTVPYISTFWLLPWRHLWTWGCNNWHRWQCVLKPLTKQWFFI